MPILNQYVGFLLNKSKISFYHTSNNSIPSTKHVLLRLLDMSCNSYRANYFRLFFYAAAFSVAHEMNTHFSRTLLWKVSQWTALSSASCSAPCILWRKRHIPKILHQRALSHKLYLFLRRINPKYASGGFQKQVQS